jgi:hypothetical protein
MAQYGPDDFAITLGGHTFEEYVDTIDGLTTRYTATLVPTGAVSEA